MLVLEILLDQGIGFFARKGWTFHKIRAIIVRIQNEAVGPLAAGSEKRIKGKAKREGTTEQGAATGESQPFVQWSPKVN